MQIPSGICIFCCPPQRFEGSNAVRMSTAAASSMTANLNFAFRQNANESRGGSPEKPPKTLVFGGFFFVFATI
jgi:hypothetical protein